MSRTWETADFSWKTVEECIKRFGPRKSPFAPFPDDYPDPQPGYEWYWVDNLGLLSGYGGWTEVDVENKRQGRFECCAIG